VWSRNRANLYIRDALDDFHYDPKALPSPITQRKIYRNKLMLTHLIGFGGGVGAAAADDDVTSYAFDGNSDYLTVPTHSDFAFGTSAFTISLWFRTLSLSGVRELIDFGAGSGLSPVIYLNGTSIVYHVQAAAKITGTSAYSVNTWHHVLVARSGTSTKMFIDGTQVGSTYTSDTDNLVSAGDLHIGRYEAGALYYLDGYVDEVTLVKGTALETTNFAPPTSQYTDSTYELQVHCGEAIASGTTGSGATFVDSGNTGHTVTENGNAIRDASIYKF